MCYRNFSKFCLQPIFHSEHIKAHQQKHWKIVLLLVGLDNAGKTTAARGLAGDFVQHVIPTVGFSSITLKHRGYSVVIYDLGGGPQIRALWRSYFCDVHGVMFVVDASDMSRIEECKYELEKLLRNEKLAGKPVLVLANKQDLQGAMDEIDVVEALKLEPLVNEQKCITLVEICSAKHLNSQNKKLDRRLLNGYRWLLGQIIKNYQSLNWRVEHDSKEEAMRIEQQRILWRQRVQNSEREESGTIIPDIDQNGDAPATIQVSPYKTSSWAHQNGVNKINPDVTDDSDDLETNSMTTVVREQFVRKSFRQKNKLSLIHRKNKVEPEDGYGPPSLALKALTSPRVVRSKELPPLKNDHSRPTTSKSLGYERKAWDLHKELVVVDMNLENSWDHPSTSINPENIGE